MNPVLAVLLMMLYSVAIFGTDQQYTQDICIPEIIAFKENDGIKLSCNISTLENQCAEWLKNGVPIPTSGRVSFGNCGHKFTLAIQRATRNDVGQYTCGAFEGSKFLKFYEAVLITDVRVVLPKEIIVYAGANLDIQCDVTGIPMPSIHWRHDFANASLDITTSDGHYVLSALNGTTNAKLSIKNITKAEEGNITCVVEYAYLTQNEETQCQVVVIQPTVPWWAIVAMIFTLAGCVIALWKTKDTCRMDPRNRAPSPVQRRTFSDSTSSSEEEFIKRNKDKIASNKKAIAMNRAYRETLKAKEPDADSGLFNLFAHSDEDE